MSNPDSFVDEVTEELRRDRASTLIRRWGWIAILAVVVLVGAAAWMEWRRSADETRARAFGDALTAGLADAPTARPDALASVAVADEGQRVLRGLLRAAALADAGDRQVAATALVELAETADLAPRYRHLTLMKAILAGGTGDPARDAAILDELAVPGAPFRPLAVEAQAMAALDAGDEATAITLLRLLTQEAGVGDALRRRAAQTIVALGATPEPA